MDPIDREMLIINSLFVRAEFYAMSAQLFTGKRRAWREDKSQRLAKLATKRTQRLLTLIDTSTSDKEIIARFNDQTQTQTQEPAAA